MKRAAFCALAPFLAAALFSGCGGSVDSIEWVAMGTVAKVSFKGGDPAVKREIAAAARSACETVESRLSIWKPDSEISRYVSMDGVSEETRPCYAAAFALKEETGGVFDPMWRGAGKGPDLGGIAKGFAVDLAAERISGILRGSGAAGKMDVLVDFGGNLKAVRGTWQVGIRDPGNPLGIVRTITLEEGMACATSGEYIRGRHIIDARTGAPPERPPASVTIVHSSSAMLADGLSTALFLLGKERGEAFLRDRHPEARAYWVDHSFLK